MKLVAVDIGNSQIKLGLFDHGTTLRGMGLLPEPVATLELPISHESGQFDADAFHTWCNSTLHQTVAWAIATVHRLAADTLIAAILQRAQRSQFHEHVRRLTYQDIHLPIRVQQPSRVGIDRLLAAVTANRLKTPDLAAIVIDLGTAITIDLVEPDGGFAGGAILPGIGMAGRALADQTDALPHVLLEHSNTLPPALGKSTQAAIESGLYWGAVGAINEIVSRLTADLPKRPECFITGGAGQLVCKSLSEHLDARFVPHLVLSGIALVDRSAREHDAPTG